MIRLKDVIQIFRGAVYHIVRQKPFVLQAQDSLGGTVKLSEKGALTVV